MTITMKHRFFATILFCLAVLSAHATIIQHVHLKDGSVLNGYIQQQDKGSNIIIFHSDNALVCLPGDRFVSQSSRAYPLAELDTAWVRWAQEHDAFDGTGSSRTLTLSEVTFKPQGAKADSTAGDGVQYLNVSKVRIIEQGAIVRFLQLTPSTYQFKWEDVNYIEGDRRPRNMLSGVDLTYLLKGGKEVTGQYAGETENTLSLYDKNGVKETYDIDQVDKYLYKAINPNQTIIDQSALLDVVKLRSGASYEGVIVERDFTDGHNNLFIEQPSGARLSVKFADIASYAKKENPAYKPKTDIVLKAGQVVINRIAADSVDVTKDGERMVINGEPTRVTLPAGTTKVVLEYFNPDHKANRLILVRLDSEKSKKKTVYSFTTDITTMKQYSDGPTQTSVNNTTSVEYTVPGAGAYAFFDIDAKRAMPFTIKP